MFRNIVFLFAVCLVIFGCSTMQEDLLLNPVGEAQFKQLDEIEEALVSLRYEIKENGGLVDGSLASGLEEIREECDALAEEASVNRQYSARLEALRGWEAYFSGESSRASRHLRTAMEFWELDESSMILKAFLIEDVEERFTFLDSCIAAGVELRRLEVERGAALFELGRFGEAVAAWDAGLPFLPEIYRTLFADDREKAWVLKGSDSGLAGGGAVLIDNGPISLGVMVDVANRETSLLDGIDKGRDVEETDIFLYLKNHGFLTQRGHEETAARRRDAAQFLWNLLAEKLGDSQMKDRFSSRFSGRTSPIPDLKVDDPWFDGALGCVQTEIMSLPDGRNFYPEEKVLGLEYLGWLNALVAY